MNKNYNVLFVGPQNSGKSHIINKIIGLDNFIYTSKIGDIGLATKCFINITKGEIKPTNNDIEEYRKKLELYQKHNTIYNSPCEIPILNDENHITLCDTPGFSYNSANHEKYIDMYLKYDLIYYVVNIEDALTNIQKDIQIISEYNPNVVIVLTKIDIMYRSEDYNIIKQFQIGNSNYEFVENNINFIDHICKNKMKHNKYIQFKNNIITKINNNKYPKIQYTNNIEDNYIKENYDLMKNREFKINFCILILSFVFMGSTIAGISIGSLPIFASETSRGASITTSALAKLGGGSMTNGIWFICDFVLTSSVIISLLFYCLINVISNKIINKKKIKKRYIDENVINKIDIINSYYFNNDTNDNDSFHTNIIDTNIIDTNIIDMDRIYANDNINADNMNILDLIKKLVNEREEIYDSNEVKNVSGKIKQTIVDSVYVYHNNNYWKITGYFNNEKMIYMLKTPKLYTHIITHNIMYMFE